MANESSEQTDRASRNIAMYNLQEILAGRRARKVKPCCSQEMCHRVDLGQREDEDIEWIGFQLSQISRSYI